MACDENGSRNRTRRGMSRTSLAGVPGVIWFDLLENETVIAHTSSDSAWDKHVLTGAEFQHLGPAIEDIVVHAEPENSVADFKFKVVLERRMRTGAWVEDDADVLPETAGNATYTVGNPFTTRSKMGRESRLVLYVRVPAASQAPVRADLSIGAAVRLYRG